MRKARIAGLAVSALLAAGGIAAAISVAHTGCSGVSVAPSSDIQNLINSNPSGTTFCFQAGTYSNASRLEPRSNDVFDGDGQKAVLDGGNTRQFAFYGNANSPGPSGVTIQDFKIQDYDTPLQYGAIQDGNGAHWVIQGNDIEHDHGAGVYSGSYAQILNNTLSNNFQEGFSAHGTGGLYQGNTIDGNNSALNSCGNDGPCAGWEAAAARRRSPRI